VRAALAQVPVQGLLGIHGATLPVPADIHLAPRRAHPTGRSRDVRARAQNVHRTRPATAGAAARALPSVTPMTDPYASPAPQLPTPGAPAAQQQPRYPRPPAAPAARAPGPLAVRLSGFWAGARLPV